MVRFAGGLRVFKQHPRRLFMCRTFLAVVLAVLVASPVAIAEQAKPGQRPPRKAAPATKPAAPAPVPAAAAEKKPEPPPPPPGVRMTTAYTQGAQISQNTTYLQGARQRVEFPGVVTLEQCDLKRSVMLNIEAKRYRVQPYPEPKPAAAPAAAEALDPQAAQMAAMMAQGQQQQKPRGGVVTFTTTLADTLERQTMFGLEARRIKTTVIKQSSQSACDKLPLKIEMDAWYVDLPQQTSCSRPAETAPQPGAADPNACTDTIETRAVGDVKLGFPIKMTTTTTTGEGNKSEAATASQEVTALEITRMDRALFEVPSGFTEAASAAEIVPAIATGGSLAEAVFGSTADGTSTAAPKKPGVTRIGILEPVNKTGRELAGAGSLRQDLVAKFNKPGYDAIALAGSSAAAIEQDAKRLEVDFVMLTEIVEAKTSKPGKLGGVMKLTGSAPKDAHDVKVEYKLFAVNATQSAKFNGNVKASNGGFGIGSALRLAAFAGQMYMSLMMGGMGMGMMNPMMAMSGMGGLGSMGGGLFDPRASAMTSMMSSFGVGMGGAGGGGIADPSEAGMRDTLSEAMGNSAKAAMEQITKKK
jgi:hypothetical protein